MNVTSTHAYSGVAAASAGGGGGIADAEGAAAGAAGHGGGHREAPWSRFPADLIRDTDAPPNCIYRRYVPERKAPYWFGKLPQGRADPKGRRGKSCGWGFYTGRSESEAADEVLTWLRDNFE